MQHALMPACAATCSPARMRSHGHALRRAHAKCLHAHAYMATYMANCLHADTSSPCLCQSTRACVRVRKGKRRRTQLPKAKTHELLSPTRHARHARHARQRTTKPGKKKPLAKEMSPLATISLHINTSCIHVSAVSIRPRVCVIRLHMKATCISCIHNCVCIRCMLCHVCI